jgi:hypothetical protein
MINLIDLFLSFRMIFHFKNTIKSKYLIFFVLTLFFFIHIFLSIFIKRNYYTCINSGNKSVVFDFFAKERQHACYNEDQKLIFNKIYDNNLNIKDLLIVIKTTESHSNRMDYIVSTWYQLAKSQVIFLFFEVHKSIITLIKIYAVTDDFSKEINEKLGKYRFLAD